MCRRGYGSLRVSVILLFALLGSERCRRRIWGSERPEAQSDLRLSRRVIPADLSKEAAGLHASLTPVWLGNDTGLARQSVVTSQSMTGVYEKFDKKQKSLESFRRMFEIEPLIF